jgi:hypothetical protein
MLLALLLALIHPAIVQTVAVDDASPPPYVYHTYIRGRFQSFGYAGELRFTISNGYVTGTYRPDTGGTLTTVHGGSQGSRIWFDIATLGGVHINATMDASGEIKGMGSSTTGGQQWVFTATPLPPSP